jgi:endonuclease/exonuclease/phosphatase family metal-dependent hydrolase
MKIMSFNTQHCANYVTKRIDYPIMAKAIKTCFADIVGLNEMRDKGEREDFDAQTAELARLTGLEHYYFAKAIEWRGSNPYGNGLLSRYPIISAETIMVPDPAEKKYSGHYETRCLLKARLECGITVLVIHFGLNPDEQKNAVDTVLEHLEEEKCVLMGDFNVTPDNDILAPIRARMKDTADAFGGQLLSFPSDEPTMKIDYIFVSPDIEVREADIPAIVASDHRPHTAEIEF